MEGDLHNRSKSVHPHGCGEHDFIINGKTGIEVKGKGNISEKDFKGLKAIQQEALLKHFILVCLEETPRKVGDIHILPWQYFLANLWQGAYG